MNDPNQTQIKSNVANIVLLLSSLVLVALLFFLRGGTYSQSQLDQLARNSLPPEEALMNDKPTVLEFYADWCEVCREMAPIMTSVKDHMDNKVDLVLLNVDNPIWQDIVEKYQVNGIPQLNFFDKDSNFVGKSIGMKKEEELLSMFNLLLNENKINDSANKSEIINSDFSSFNRNENFYLDKSISPRSHG
tara:strand:+ start:759 stop:1328 length:570 start_codon:yes stop_codon:yes gene_type:complete